MFGDPEGKKKFHLGKGEHDQGHEERGGEGEDSWRRTTAKGLVRNAGADVFITRTENSSV